MIKTITLFLSLIIISSAFSKEIKPEHIMCKQNSDCVLIEAGGCCGADTAINKSYANEFKKKPHKRCADSFVRCLKTSVLCKNNVCSSVLLDEK